MYLHFNDPTDRRPLNAKMLAHVKKVIKSQRIDVVIRRIHDAVSPNDYDIIELSLLVIV